MELIFSYDEAHHLIAMEMKNPFGKAFSWIHFSYEITENTSQVYITTSDNRELTFQFVANQLSNVSGSHAIPVSYEYNSNLMVLKKRTQNPPAHSEYNLYKNYFINIF